MNYIINRYLGSLICFVGMFLFFPNFLFAKESNKDININAILKKFENIDEDLLIHNGIDYLNRNVLDSAFICFSVARSKTENFKDDETLNKHISALDGLGIVSFLYGNYSNAYQLFAKTIEINPDYTNGYMNLANIYQMFGDDKLARENLLKAYQSYMSKGELDNMAISLSDIFEYDIIHDETSNSYDLARNFFKLNYEEKSPALEYAQLLGRGLIDLHNNKANQAVEKFKECLRVIDDTPLFMKTRFESVTLACIGTAWDKAGRIDSAIYYMRRAFNNAYLNDHPDLSISTGKILGDFFSRNNMPDSSIIYKYRALSLADSISTYSEYGKIKGMEMQRNVEDAQQKIEKFKSETHKRNLLIIGMGIIIILFILILLWNARKNRQLHNKDIHIYNAINSENMPLIENKDLLNKGSSEYEKNEADAEIEKKYKNSIDEIHVEQLVAKIEDVMAHSDEWRKPKFSLSDMAEMVNDTSRNVSQVINDKYHKNFSVFINEHKIRYCIQYMKENPDILNYTIDAIADEFGFSNRTYFTSIFKSIIGMTPSAWIKIQREQIS